MGNFRGRKLSRISRFYSRPRSFSPRNFRHATLIYAISLTFCESFLREMLPSYRSVKVFSLENFPLYGTLFIKTLHKHPRCPGPLILTLTPSPYPSPNPRTPYGNPGQVPQYHVHNVKIQYSCTNQIFP